MTSSPSTSAPRERRDRVLAALRSSPEALTIPQLAERCECSQVSVRRALRPLIDLGLVDHVGNLPRYDHRQKLRWGRGHALYVAYTPWTSAE